MFRTILVPLSGWADDTEGSPDADALNMALSMAKEIEAHVEAFHCAPSTGSGSTVLPAGLPGSTAELLITEIEKAAEERRDAAEAIFEAAVDRHNPPRRSKPENNEDIFSVSFVEETGDLRRHLASRARVADICVVGLGGGDPAVTETTEICLRDSGRPVLAVPAGRTEWRSGTIAIGWNGSVEAARAVSIASDLLSQADNVTVISVDEDGPVRPDAHQLLEGLAWHGIMADTVTVPGTRESAGSLLMERAEAIGADLLVMGAYTRNRFSQLIFGSATADVLHGASIPVLMIH